MKEFINSLIFNYEIYIQLSKLMNLLILIFFVLIAVQLNSIRVYLPEIKKRQNFLKLAFQFMIQPAWLFFARYAQVNHQGTYLESFIEHNQLQKKVKLYTKTVLGFATVKIICIIMVTLLIGNYFLFN